VPIHEEAVAAAYRICEDGMGRWLDLDLASWLGYENLYRIRTLIERNRHELEQHGLLTAVVKSSGGRPATEFWLNPDQATAACQLARTPMAETVRVMIVKVIGRVRDGISTEPRMELRVLEVAADRIVAPILREQREFFTGVPAHDRTG